MDGGGGIPTLLATAFGVLAASALSTALGIALYAGLALLALRYAVRSASPPAEPVDPKRPGA